MIDLQVKPIGALTPAPYNPRVALKPESKAYRRLARSLREFDLVQPIVWNERTGHVVGGHQRLQILEDQGVDEVEVAVVSLPLEREKTLNVALNNGQLASEWDTAKLVALLDELSGLAGFDETLTGFDADEMRDLVLTPERTLPTASDREDDGRVRVLLEVVAENWEGVRDVLDGLVREYGVDVHVTGES